MNNRHHMQLANRGVPWDMYYVYLKPGYEYSSTRISGTLVMYSLWVRRGHGNRFPDNEHSHARQG